MKRNIFKITALALLILSVGTSCNDWLDVKPRTEEDAERLYKTLDGFKEALAGTYTLMSQPGLYGRELTFGTVGILGQEWIDGGLSQTAGGRSLLNNYRMDEVAVRAIIDPIWGKIYNAIANANELIEFTDKKRSVVGDMYGVVRGEAVAIRAYLHFDVLRLYATYGDFDNDTDAVLPYIFSPKPVITGFVTKKEYVKNLLDDIEEALELLKDDPITSGGSSDMYFVNRDLHLNYYAVVGLKARILQYLGRASEARQQAELVISAQDTGLFPWIDSNAANPPAASADRDRTFSTEQLFALNTVKLVDNIKEWFTETSNNYYTWRLFGTANFGVGDYRALNFETLGGSPNVFSKFWQTATITGTHPIRDRMPMIRISEMYYIAAEGYIGNDNDEALRLINEVLTARNIASDELLELPGTDDETFLKDALLAEYQKEFIGEGVLYYYHKMLGTVRISSVRTVYTLPIPDREMDYRGEEETE